jgi:methionyl-tRNA formyltransferase
MIKVLFMGRKPVAARALEYLLTLPGVDVVGVRTDSHLAVSPTANLARGSGIRLYEFSEALAALKTGRLQFDLGLSMLYWKKLTEEFLSVPSRGVINFHPAPLPEYKGTAGYNLAILEQRDSWAVTAHYMDEQIDTGGIVKSIEFSIDSDAETAQSLEKKAQVMLYELFRHVLAAALHSDTMLPAAPNVGGRYVSRAEMERMKEIKSGDDIPRKIRAFWFPPYDGAYQVIENRKYTLVDRSILQKLGDPDASSLFTAEKC